MKPSFLFRLVLLAPLALCTRLLAAVPAPEIHELPKMEVKASIVCSFGIGVVAAWNEETQRISHLYVEAVAPDSDAAIFGLVPGDEILSINGQKVSALKGGSKRGSDLFNLLVNQPQGKKIDIEVAVRVVKRVSLSAGLF